MPEPAAALALSVAGPTSLPASGRGIVEVRLVVRDAEGRAPETGTLVSVTVAQGDASFEGGRSQLDVPCSPGGLVVVPLHPGTIAGKLTLRVSLPTGLAQTVDLDLVTAPRLPLVVGVATLGVGAVPGPVEALDGGPSGADTRRAAASLYATGSIARNTNATFAYNSADTLDQQIAAGPFVDNPDERAFPIYGDSSVRYDDALSRYRMYARIENGRSSGMLGEFQALASTDDIAGGYSVLVNGARLHAEGNALGLTAFTAKNDVAYDRVVISPTGLSVASQALHGDIVVGSDVLMLVHLDRRTGAILAQTPLVRGVDYTLDYASGLLRFLNIVLPFDDALNPQVVVAQYEYGGGDANSMLFGASGSLKLGSDGKTHIDSWYLNDSVGSGNLTLFGQALAGQLPGGTWALGREHSNGFIPISQTQFGNAGDNYLATFDVQRGPFTADVRAGTTSAGYTNPFGAYATPGLTSISARLARRMSRIASLELSYLAASNQLPASTAGSAVSNRDAETQLRLNVHPSPRFSYHIGLKSDNASGNGTVDPIFFAPANGGTLAPPSSIFSSSLFAPVAGIAGVGSSLDALYGANWQFSPHASLGVSRSDPLGASNDPYDPQQTEADLTVDVGKQAKAFVRQLWQSAQVQPLALTQGQQTYAATATSTTSAGITQQVGNATLEYGYAVDHTANSTDLYNAIGIHETFAAGNHLSGDAFAQVGRSLLPTFATSTGSGTPSFFVLGTALNYALPTFHATGSVQVRNGYNSGSTYQLGATGAISRDVSLFASFLGAYTSEVTDSDLRMGLSYRPSRNDRYVTLATVDTQNSNLTTYDGYVSNVAQLQELYRPSTRTEFAGSVAYKITGDAYFQPSTTIYGLRVDQRIGPRFDLATEVHKSSTAPLGGVQATGFVAEAGWRLGDAFRLATGYNFSGFTDPSTAVNPTHRGVYLTVSSYVDRIFGWGEQKRP